MTKLRQVLSIVFDALTEGNRTAANDTFAAEGEQERRAAQRAAAGDESVQVTHPLIWDAHKPRGK